jgi:hypothetical protein
LRPSIHRSVLCSATASQFTQSEAKGRTLHRSVLYSASPSCSLSLLPALLCSQFAMTGEEAGLHIFNQLHNYHINFICLLIRPHPLILLQKEKDGAALQVQTSYLPHQLQFFTHHFRKLRLISESLKSEGCAWMASSFGGGREEALYSTLSNSPINFDGFERQGLCVGGPDQIGIGWGVHFLTTTSAGTAKYCHALSAFAASNFPLNTTIRYFNV